MSISFDVLMAIDVSYLDERWLDENGRIRLLPAEEFRSVPLDHLRIWCHKHARYGIPTLELVEWLREQIDDQMAIEVGAGCGDLGYHLGIIRTDSYIQTDPKVRSYFFSLGQVPVTPPPDVIRMDAERAVRKYKPDVVIASWLTRRFVPGRDRQGVSQAFAYGAREEEIVRAATYIHIGNRNVHGEKNILSLPHEEYQFDWLVSRARDQSQNVIWVWRRDR